MAKIDVTIPDDLKEILQELANDTGQSLSAVAADCIKLGVLDFIETRTKMEVYRKLRRQNQQKGE
ncbi:MAG: ribbon-helix-helix protein, CopG family [Nostoc sp. TH1S01]|nr:ribbon-helix-helix protein, CopG family [Nostoc sp. TH1S01]OCQ92263.1 hypothetical protein BCD64_00160 [Nostoc sp. MBR 210]